MLGFSLGLTVGTLLGRPEGFALGKSLGLALGKKVGVLLEASLGFSVGDMVGPLVGFDWLPGRRVGRTSRGRCGW